MKVYNVWTIIEVEDTENDTFEDLKDEQVCVGHFKNFDGARSLQNSLNKEYSSNDDGWYENLINKIEVK